MSDNTDETSAPASSIRPARIAETTAISTVPAPESEPTSARTGWDPGPQADVKNASMIDNEPDYRFTLANERTFLAWARTALALLAGGVAVGQLFATGMDEVGHRVLGIACVVLATTVAIGAFTRWRQVQAAMRRNDPLPGSLMVRLTVIGICVSAVICAVLILA
jgi:putative membrane protein